MKTSQTYDPTSFQPQASGWRASVSNRKHLCCVSASRCSRWREDQSICCVTSLQRALSFLLQTWRVAWIKLHHSPEDLETQTSLILIGPEAVLCHSRLPWRLLWVWGGELVMLPCRPLTLKRDIRKWWKTVINTSGKRAICSGEENMWAVCFSLMYRHKT